MYKQKHIFLFVVISILLGLFVYTSASTEDESNQIVNDIMASDEFAQLKGFKQLGFKAEYGNSPPLLFDKESNYYENKKGNKFKSKFLEIESIYEEIDTSFFNVDEKPVKQKYVIKNLKNTKKNIKINLIYEIDSDFVVWNGTNYTISTTPQYFEAFEQTIELFPGLTETFLTGHFLSFGNNFFGFRDIVDLDYKVSVYSSNDKNYIDLEINDEIDGLDGLEIDPIIAFSPNAIESPDVLFTAVFPEDIDKDGDIDVVAGSVFPDALTWYENDGSKDPSFTRHIIIATNDNVPFVRDVFAVDLDNDGDKDILRVSSFVDRFDWFENDGSKPPSWTRRFINAQNPFGFTIFSVDLDGDGDNDIVTDQFSFNATGGFSWYDNDGSKPPSFAQRLIPTSDSGVDVFAIDIDGDNDIDVVKAGEASDKITWHENDGSKPPSFSEHTIATSVDGARGVFAIDIDNDGDTDVISASVNDDTVRWYENDGSKPPSWTTHVLTTSADFAISVSAADIDNDGDIDVLSGSAGDTIIRWFENDGSKPPSFTAHNVATFFVAPPSHHIFARDFDNDGDLDILGVNDWFESDLTAQPPIDLEIIEIIPIQVVKNVDLVKGKTTLVRAVVKNNGATNVDVTAKLFFENSLKDIEIDTINAGQQKNIDLFFVPDSAGGNKEIRVEVT